MSLTLTIKRGGGESNGYGTSISIQDTIGGGHITSLIVNGNLTQGENPSPDNQQTISVVTGSQTVTITDGGSNSVTKTINLGSIELCKLGEYSDYIYKSGGNWYIHKEINKVALSESSSWVKSAYGTNTYFVSMPDIFRGRDNIGICTPYFVGVSYNDRSVEMSNIIYLDANSTGISIRNTSWNTLSEFTTWITNHNFSAYYVWAEAYRTDTKITDSVLIADLESVLSVSTYDGETNISVIGNLASPLSVTLDSYIIKTYTETELGAPFTISDIEGKSQNTTLDGNIYVDFIYDKKQFSVDIFNLTPSKYEEIRGFYDYQFTSGQFPTISIPELNIENMVVFFEISSRNIVNQCLLTNKLTLKFRETVQP